MKSVVITGVSTGIGLGAAKVLVKNGFHVFGSVRKKSDAEALGRELGENFTPLIFDVTSEEQINAAATLVEKKLNGEPLFGLVNNAGIAVSGPLQYLTKEEFRFQFDVNVMGPFLVTKAFLPLLGAKLPLLSNPGRIVNMSSVGGKIGAPFLGAYTASKFSIEGYSESLRRELMMFGIEVVVIGPGSVATPIWDKADAEEESKYDATPYKDTVRAFKSYMIRRGKKGLSPEELGTVVLEALTAKKPRLRYAPVPNKFFEWTIPMILPKRWVDNVMAKRLKLK